MYIRLYESLWPPISLSSIVHGYLGPPVSVYIVYLRDISLREAVLTRMQFIKALNKYEKKDDR